VNNSAKRITIDPNGPWRLYLMPGDLTRPDIEWLGTVTRGSGETGALGRIRATGLLVQVNASATRTLDQRKAEAALLAALQASAYCERCETRVAVREDRGDALCARCGLVL
jgi:hypothetical protein